MCATCSVACECIHVIYTGVHACVHICAYAGCMHVCVHVCVYIHPLMHQDSICCLLLDVNNS